MANKAHNTLTGSSLHENKGAATATDDFVATVTAGATVWKKLTAANLTGTANAFGGQLLHIQNKGLAGSSDGSSLSSGVWTTRTLNTVATNEIASASLSTNSISLPAGTYWIDWRCPYVWGDTSDYFNSRLYNSTDAAVAIPGSSTIAATTSDPRQTVWSFGRGRLVLAGTKSLVLQHVSQRAFSAGTSAIGSDTIYSDITIFKVA